MNVPIDTLAFAKSFEDAGFGHDQAHVLASAFGATQVSIREDLVTKDYLDARLAEIREVIVESRSATSREIAENSAALMKKMTEATGTINKQLADLSTGLNKQFSDFGLVINKQISDNTLMLTRQIADNGRDVSTRLWSTITIIAGVSTAISATIGAGVALLLHAKGI